MHLIDMTILAVLFFFALKGALRGLVNEVSSLVGLLAGGWLAYRFYSVLAVPIRVSLHIPAYISSFLAFMLILMTIGIIAHILGNIITTALRIVMLGSFNRIGGLLLGAAEGAMLLCLLFSVGTVKFMPENLKKVIYSSESATMFVGAGDKMLSVWRGKSADKP